MHFVARNFATLQKRHALRSVSNDERRPPDLVFRRHFEICIVFFNLFTKHMPVIPMEFNSSPRQFHSHLRREPSYFKWKKVNGPCVLAAHPLSMCKWTATTRRR